MSQPVIYILEYKAQKLCNLWVFFSIYFLKMLLCAYLYVTRCTANCKLQCSNLGCSLNLFSQNVSLTSEHLYYFHHFFCYTCLVRIHLGAPLNLHGPPCNQVKILFRVGGYCQTYLVGVHLGTSPVVLFSMRSKEFKTSNPIYNISNITVN